MKRVIWTAVLTALIVTGIANAGAIKTWTTETLRYSDLNSNFQHIHNTMVGGHGARLLDADVSASAAIAHSKLATPALVPKVWASVLSDCSASPCTVSASSGVSSITRSGTGEYDVLFSNVRANAVYGALITPFDATGLRSCRQTSAATNGFHVSCFDAAAAVDTGFTVMILDNDN